MNQLKNIGNLRFIRRIHATGTKFTTGVSEPSIVNPTEEQELVPSKPVASKIDVNLLPPTTKLDLNTIILLERLSLCNIDKREGVDIVESAIQFADQILQIDTEGVEALITVLEDRPLVIREDDITDGNRKNEVLANSASPEDDYLLAPPENNLLASRENFLMDVEAAAAKKEDNDKK